MHAVRSGQANVSLDNSVRFGSVRFGSILFNVIRFDPIRSDTFMVSVLLIVFTVSCDIGVRFASIRSG